MKRSLAGAAALAGIAMLWAATAGGAAIAAGGTAIAAGLEGIWLTEKGDAQIEIADCGGILCGRIVWLREPLRDGKPVVDAKNPDPSLRNRPLIGLVILASLLPADEPNKWKGSAYNADDGGVYAVEIRLRKDTTGLKIEGCWAIFCDSEKWTRVK